MLDFSLRSTGIIPSGPHQILFPAYIRRDPVESVRKKILKAEGLESGKRTPSTIVEQHRGVEGLTLADLSAKWRSVVKALKGNGVHVVNPGHALEGALSIR